MKQSLPWNVTGIPPEVREAARTAAAREGMSVGDWLTRRILTESSGFPQEFREPPPLAAPPPPPPPPPATFRYAREPDPRRERDEMVHNIGRVSFINFF